MKKNINFRVVITIFAVCVIASAFFCLLYTCDNKYNTQIKRSQDNAVLIPDSMNEDGTQNQEVTWLIQGWEFYPDQLIYPDNLTGESTSIYIGQYFSFSKFHEDGSPYGIGTYRLKLSGKGYYTVMIPEVFSSCIVYIDDKKIDSSGSITPYKSYVKDLMFSFELNGTAELLIQTANYSHYYSGLTYPPAIGSSEAIIRLVTIRILFYGFLVFTSLALALYAAVIWFGTKKNKTSSENFWLGILGLSFSLRVCYPFIHMLGFSDGNLAYILETTMSSFALFCITRSVSLICLKTDSMTERILKGITGGFILTGLVFSTFMIRYLPGFVPLYGQILYWYKVLIALILGLLLIRRIAQKNCGQILLLLAGLSVYLLSLLYHALCLGHYEPAYMGWFEEWGIYILIVCFSVRMSLRNMEIIQENRYLNKHLQEEIAHKTESLSKLLEERRMLLSGFAHDLKTPITSISTFTRLVELDNTQLDEESRQYLDIIRQKTREIQEQLSTINELTHIDSNPPSFEALDFRVLLETFYTSIKPDVDVSGIFFDLILQDKQPVIIYGDRWKLTSILQNIVFNAVNCTQEGGKICLCLSREDGFAVLRIEDNGSGISEEDMPHIFDIFFTNRINGNGSGIGLYIVKSFIIEHGGSIHVDSVPKKGSVFTIRLPIMQ